MVKKKAKKASNKVRRKSKSTLAASIESSQQDLEVIKSISGKKSNIPSDGADQKNVVPRLKRALTFKLVSEGKDLRNVFDYNIDAFSDSPDFHWGVDEIKEEIKDGWQLYGVYLDKEVMASVFLKEVNGSLLTKNTAIKMQYQGQGYSHQIKEFIEKKAREMGLKEIRHYCRIDNFRMYSLNEKHGYKKTDRKVTEDQVVEWVKTLGGRK